MKKLLSFYLLIVLVFLISTDAVGQYQEKYRPQFHFSPKNGWIGDPDGLVYYKGLYHLFWWGHAVSKDLVHWKQLPYPMQGDDGSFVYFSGSMVVDNKNTSGFGDSTMVAVYTMHNKKSGKEMQGLSYSKDDIYFQFYKDNPVLDIGEKDFRDPQVFWYEPDEKWVMVIALPKAYKVQFYASDDLKSWQYLSEFGPMGVTQGVWECPDLFKLPVNGDTTNIKWVLVVGQGPNKIQYFLGDFDGKGFVPDAQTRAIDNKDSTLWVDEGADFYAVRSWRNVDNTNDSKRVWIGWMGNWEYANHVPTKWGKGFESIPRKLSLKTFPEGIRLVQQPISSLKKLRENPIEFGGVEVNGIKPIKKLSKAKNTYELHLRLTRQTASSFGLNLLVGEGRKLTLTYDVKKAVLVLDRTHCSDFQEDSVFNRYFPKKMKTSLPLKDESLDLLLFVDKSSIEIFVNGGKIVLSALTFPARSQTGVEVFSNGGDVKIDSFKSWELKSIWN